jgi:hypothetical protein
MHRYTRSVRLTLATVVVAALFVALALAGCGAPAKSATTPKVASTAEATSVEAPAPGSEAVGPGGVPDKVTAFAKDYKGQVWWPSLLPAGLKLDSVDVLELEPGSGFVCDSYFISGDIEVGFLQGSPKTREYEIPSVGKVPWGTETADVIYEDPEDVASPKMIVYSANGNLAELAGGTSFEDLKAIAASMVIVK